MRKLIALFFGLLAWNVVAQSFTTLDTADYWGTTDRKNLTAGLDANFGKIGGTVGAVSTNGESAVEYAGQVHMSTITFANTTVATDGSDEGETEVIYTFPQGRIYILGAAINAVVGNNTNCTEATANDVYYVAIGTAAAGDDADLTSTEADIIAKTTLDTDSGSVLSFDWEADMTSGGDTVFDGTATAVDLHLNLAIANTSLSSENMTNTFAGTLNVFWINLGDD